MPRQTRAHGLAVLWRILRVRPIAHAPPLVAPPVTTRRLPPIMICPWCIDYDAWRSPVKESTFLPDNRCYACKRSFPQSDDEWRRAYSSLTERKWTAFSYALGNADAVPDRVYVGFANENSAQGIVREHVKGLFKKKRYVVDLPQAEQLRLFKMVCEQHPAHIFGTTAQETPAAR